jgi:hypothetical protein
MVVVVGADGVALNIINVGGALLFDPLTSDDIDPGVNTDSLIEGLILPVDGLYRIEVYGAEQTSGPYTLTIESAPPS